MAFPRQLATVYGAHGLNGLLGVLAVPVALQRLGFAGYGMLSLYTLLLSYVLLADFGVSKNLLRMLSECEDPNRRREHIRSVAGFYVLLCGAVLLAYPVLAVLVPKFLFTVPPEQLSALRWMIALAMLEFTIGVPVSLMQTNCVADQRFGAYAKFSLLSGLNRNAALLAGVALFSSPVGVAGLLAARRLLDVVLAGKVMGWLAAGCGRPSFGFKRLRGLLSQSTSLSIAQVLNCTLTAIGSPLVNASFGLGGVGLYRSAFDLAGKIGFVSTGLGMVAFPKAARHFGVSPDRAVDRPMFETILRSSSVAYCCFAAVALLAAPTLLPRIGLGSDEALRLFSLLVIALSLNAHALLGNELVQATGRYRYNIYFGVSALVTLGIIYLVARPAFGLAAIGWSWLGAAVVSTSLSDGLFLSLCGSGLAAQVQAVGLKLLLTGACLVVAACQFGMLPEWAGWMAALLLTGLFATALREMVHLCRREPDAGPMTRLGVAAGA